jgi:hypothetical protein
VLNKTQEAHLTKCCCSKVYQQQHWQQQGEDQGQGKETGDKQMVALMIPSKASYCADLSPGNRIWVLPPFHEVKMPGGCLVILANSIAGSV